MQCDKLQFSPKKGKFSSSAHSTSTPCFFKEDETGEREDSQQFDHDDDGDDDDDDLYIMVKCVCVCVSVTKK